MVLFVVLFAVLFVVVTDGEIVQDPHHHQRRL
jgi:hypothetical protein